MVYEGGRVRHNNLCTKGKRKREFLGTFDDEWTRVPILI